MAKLSTGQTTGKIPGAETAQRLLGGLAEVASAGALAQQSIATPALRAQAKPVDTNQTVGAPTLGGPTKIPSMAALPNLPRAPALPRPTEMQGIPSNPSLPSLPNLPRLPELPGLISLPGMPALPRLPEQPKPNQDLANLAQALSSFNQNLQQVGRTFQEVGQQEEKKAASEGAQVAAQFSGLGYTSYKEALAAAEKAAAVDPTRAADLNLLKTLDPRRQRYFNEQLGDSNFKQRMAEVKNTIAYTKKLPDGRLLETVPPNDPALIEWQRSLAVPANTTPKAFFENQPQFQALMGSVNSDQIARYAKHSDEKLFNGFNVGLGGSMTELASGTISSEGFAAKLGASLDGFQQGGGTPGQYQTVKSTLPDRLIESALAAVGNRPNRTAIIENLIPNIIKSLHQTPAGPNGEPLINQLGMTPEAVALYIARGMNKGLNADRADSDRNEATIGKDAAVNDVKAAPMETPGQVIDSIAYLRRQAEITYANNPERLSSYLATLGDLYSNKALTVVKPVQEAKAREFDQRDPTTTTPAKELVEYARAQERGELSQEDYTRLTNTAKARMDTANNANFKLANQNEKDLRARLTKEYETSGYGDKKPGISPAENVEISNRIGEYRRQTTELIQKAKGADISNDLNDLYLKATAPQQQRAQRRELQPAYATPETVKTKLDRTSAEVKRNYRSGPLYPEPIFGKQLDDVMGNKPLDGTTKEIIRRLGVTPLEYFTQQNDKHAPGKPLPAPVQEKLKELDKVSLVLPVSGGGSMGLGMITPDMARAQRMWSAMQPKPNVQTTMPSSTAAKSSGSSNGLLALIRSGEGSWNSVNRGRAGDSSPINLTSMTIGAVEQLQQRNKIFAAGAYQFTPDVLSLARREAGLSPSDPMSPENQNKMAMALVIGSKRPALAAYVTGKNNNLNAAHYDIAREWAALQAPNGRGMYDGDKAGNMASIPAAKVRAMLIEARQQYLSQRN
jgi:hypothetical protein